MKSSDVLVIYREITKWSTPTPNHRYLLSKDKYKMYAYEDSRTGRVIEYSEPMSFNPKGRVFVQEKVF